VALGVTLLLGAALHRAHRLQLQRGTPPIAAASTPQTPPPNPSPALPTKGDSGGNVQNVPQTAAVTPEQTPPPARATPPGPRSDLSGVWQGEYVDAAGQRLLRVVNLSIDRVNDDGGIEGSLAYESAAGHGECKLRARGSTYLVTQHRLQLSPEGCSPHYPRELGVPLDFDAVSPESGSLGQGRIEAPNGAMISVRLTRASGV
jgi:hypothetical protein